MVKPPCVRAAGESARAMALQVLLPFLLSGLGMVGAGLLLDALQVSLTTAESRESHQQTLQKIGPPHHAL